MLCLWSQSGISGRMVDESVPIRARGINRPQQRAGADSELITETDTGSVNGLHL